VFLLCEARDYSKSGGVQAIYGLDGAQAGIKKNGDWPVF
jgi:hypothetical protein